MTSVFQVANPTRHGVAPAGSNWSGGVGDDTAEAVDGKDRLSGSVSRQAVTRVNAEQVSKSSLWGPTRQWLGEVDNDDSSQPTLPQITL
jgi:hypothetical protein